jgi:hypothetical protein
MVRTRFMVVQEAIDVLLLHLECVPPSEGAELLRSGIDECITRLARWRASPPTDRDRDELMKRVLALHVKVTKLEQHPVQRLEYPQRFEIEATHVSPAPSPLEQRYHAALHHPPVLGPWHVARPHAVEPLEHTPALADDPAQDRPVLELVPGRRAGIYDGGKLIAEGNEALACWRVLPRQDLESRSDEGDARTDCRRFVLSNVLPQPDELGGGLVESAGVE